MELVKNWSSELNDSYLRFQARLAPADESGLPVYKMKYKLAMFGLAVLMALWVVSDVILDGSNPATLRYFCYSEMPMMLTTLAVTWPREFHARLGINMTWTLMVVWLIWEGGLAGYGYANRYEPGMLKQLFNGLPDLFMGLSYIVAQHLIDEMRKKGKKFYE